MPKKTLKDYISDNETSQSQTVDKFQSVIEDVTEKITKEFVEEAKQELDEDLSELEDKVSESLKKNEKYVLSLIPKKGEKGEPGPIGPKGEAGKDGKQGIMGLVGPPGLLGLPGKDGKDGKDAEIDLDKLKNNIKKEMILFLPHGGGNANRNITVGGNSSTLSRYTDINIIAGSGASLSYVNNDTTKRLDLTITATGTSRIENEVPSMLSGTQFAIDNVPSIGTVRFYEGNRRLTPVTDFSVSGSVITLTYTPPTESDKLVDYQF